MDDDDIDDDDDDVLNGLSDLNHDCIRSTNGISDGDSSIWFDLGWWHLDNSQRFTFQVPPLRTIKEN